MPKRIMIQYQGQTIRKTLGKEDSYQTFFSDVISHLKISDFDSEHNFTLLEPISNVFINSIASIIASTSPTFELVDITQLCQTAISNLTAIRAQLNDDAQTRQMVAHRAKRTVFQLEVELKNDIYGEEFICQGGMQPLVEIIRASDGNTQAYALKALSKSLCYLNGLEYMKCHPGLLDVLVGLTYETRNIITAREALSLVFVICTYVDDGFDLVHRAAKRTALSTGTSPYSQLMRLLTSGDLDAQINSLTLINVLLLKAPSKRKRKKLILQLDSLGLLDILESQQNQIGHNDYLGQVEQFERLSGLVCSSSIFQLQALKRRISELQSQAESARSAIEQIESNRARVDIVRRELYRYRQAVQTSFDAGVLINARAPIQRFADQGEYTAKLQSISVLAGQISSHGAKYIGLDDNNHVLSLQGNDGNNQLPATFIVQNPQEPNPTSTKDAHDVAPVNSSSSEIVKNLSKPSPPDELISDATDSASNCAVPSAATVSERPAAPPPPCPAVPPPPGQPLTGPKPTKPMIKPRVKMKPLHWKRIILDIQLESSREAIWSMLKTPSDSVLNMDDFIDRFSSSATVQSSKTVFTSGLLAKTLKTRVLSEKRSQAIAIMMSQLPNEFDCIRSAILRLDSNVLHPDQVQAIFGNLPSKEEGDLLQSVGESPNLDRPEHFLMKLIAIPHLQQRLSAWLFALNIDDNVTLLSTQFEHIQAACQVLLGSESVRLIISIILTLGNYMNGGTNRGQADGFNLDVLSSLDNSKSRDSSKTLLHYIAQVCYRAKPSIRTLHLEMTPVFTAQNALSIQELNMNLSSLQSQCDFIERDYLKVLKCDPQDQFQPRIQESLLNAKRSLSKLISARHRTDDVYNKILDYFTASAAYDLSTSPAFFEIFASFLHRFHDALPSEIKPSRDSLSKIRRHAIGEKIADGDMSDVIASIRKGHYLARHKTKIPEGQQVTPLETVS